MSEQPRIPDLAAEIGLLRYAFYSLPPLVRLRVVLEVGLVTPEALDRVPLSFWKECFNRGVEHDATRLQTAILRSEVP